MTRRPRFAEPAELTLDASGSLTAPRGYPFSARGGTEDNWIHNRMLVWPNGARICNDRALPREGPICRGSRRRDNVFRPSRIEQRASLGRNSPYPHKAPKRDSLSGRLSGEKAIAPARLNIFRHWPLRYQRRGALHSKTEWPAPASVTVPARSSPCSARQC